MGTFEHLLWFLGFLGILFGILYLRTEITRRREKRRRMRTPAEVKAEQEQVLLRNKMHRDSRAGGHESGL